MRILLNKIVVFGLLFLMLSFTTDGKLACHLCPEVSKSNRCATVQSACETNGYCYVGRFSRDGKTIKVIRGCTNVCRNVVHVIKSRIDHYWCCERDYCNTYNAWSWEMLL
ncbi:hypothetical protein JRQ81_010864 [Phrynocephalus forsythii]|uniref:Snake toxin/toxin-like domain-containing protein n=1 Tax=Phrynocephalus forsythii TaxID=171643 RepID=A0A9Q0X782_9SAUR|nr:hypothetical protein JRQ81_010864 [Phrynocephalus forsythii]